MYTFDQFLLESQMPYREAVKVLGLEDEDNVTPETIKKAFRKASMRAHPDRGGSDEAMQRVNAAYNVLKDAGRIANQKKARDDSNNEAKAMAHSLLERFDFGAYNAHLSKLFGVNLKTSDNYEESYYYLRRNVEFASEDRETVVSVDFTFSLSSFISAASLGYGDGEMIPGELGVGLEILHNRQQMKVNQRDYDITRSVDIFDTPEIVFPSKKIARKIDLQSPRRDTMSKSGFTYSVRAEKIKKRDFISTLKHKFSEGEMVKGDVFQITRNGVTIQAHRHTMIRQGFWQMIILPRKYDDRKNIMHSIPETDVGLQFIINLIAEVTASKRPELTWKRYIQYSEEMYEGDTFKGI